jgi:RNA polymerase sigma factor (sigma-70 family)
MGRAPASVLLRHLHTLTAARAAGEASDRDLLRRFAVCRDEGAFVALVRRHGPMVFQVGRRTLANCQDAEDVFQATFLVLAAKAGARTWQESVGNWLYGVARHLALKARTAAARRAAREVRATVPPSTDPLAEITGRELRSALDDELARLPEKYRAPLVLCYLEGATRDEAARQLGWPLGTLKSRVERGRELLRARLTRRGLTLGVALSAATLADNATCIAARDGLIRAAVFMAEGKALTGGLVSTRVLGLTNAGVSAVLPVRKVILAAVLLALSSFALAAPFPATGPERGGDSQPAAVPQKQLSEEKEPRTDLDGVPLPAEAVARMGSGRLRHGGLCRLAFLPDGKSLVSGGFGGVRIWDVKTGKRTLRHGDQPHWHMAFAYTDGSLTTVSADLDGKQVTAEVIDLASGKLVRRVPFQGRASGIIGAVSPDGKRVAFAVDNTVRLHDAATGKETLRVPVRGPFGRSIAFAPDGKSFAVADFSDTVAVHDTSTGKIVRELRDTGAASMLVYFSPNGRFLASVLFKGEGTPWEMSLFDLAAGKERYRLRSPEGRIHILAFSPDGKYLAMGCQLKELILWDVATGREVRRLGSAGSSAAFSPDGKTLAAVSGQGAIRLWDVATGNTLPASADPLINHISGLRFGAGGKHLVGAAGLCIAWDPLTGREVRRFPRVPGDSWFFPLSPDETLLANSFADGTNGTIRLWDATTGREVRTLKGHEKGVWELVFAPDGRRLISSGTDGTIRVWDVATGRQLHRLTGQGNRVQYLAASSDGRWLASASDKSSPQGGYEVFLWDLTAGREKARLALAGWASQLTFSPDSRLLAVVGGDRGSGPGLVTIWDLARGNAGRAFVGHKEHACSVAFSPDGRTLATGARGGSLFLWEVRTGRVRHSFIGHEHDILSVAFSPDGRRLAASSAEAPVYVWAVAGEFPRRLTAADLDRAWNALAGQNAVAAFDAIRRLAAAPENAVPFLRERLKPAVAVDPKRVRELVRRLDSPRFTEREKAKLELAELAPRAEASLRRELKEAASLEVRRRIEQILERLEAGPPDVLRSVRAVEALERMGTPEAMRLLDALAGGAAEAVLTHEATAARDRLRALTQRTGER